MRVRCSRGGGVSIRWSCSSTSSPSARRLASHRARECRPIPHCGRLLLQDPPKEQPRVHLLLYSRQVGEVGALVVVHRGFHRTDCIPVRRPDPLPGWTRRPLGPGVGALRFAGWARAHVGHGQRGFTTRTIFSLDLVPKVAITYMSFPALVPPTFALLKIHSPSYVLRCPPTCPALPHADTLQPHLNHCLLLKKLNNQCIMLNSPPKRLV